MDTVQDNGDWRNRFATAPQALKPDLGMGEGAFSCIPKCPSFGSIRTFQPVGAQIRRTHADVLEMLVALRMKTERANYSESEDKSMSMSFSFSRSHFS